MTRKKKLPIVWQREVSKAAKVVGLTDGQFFYCEFVKKDGTIRKMVARINVRRNLTGEGLAYNPVERNLCVVWDMKAQDYRMLNLATLLYLKCGDLVYDDRAVRREGST